MLFSTQRTKPFIEQYIIISTNEYTQREWKGWKEKEGKGGKEKEGKEGETCASTTSSGVSSFTAGRSSCARQPIKKKRKRVEYCGKQQKGKKAEKKKEKGLEDMCEGGNV